MYLFLWGEINLMSYTYNNVTETNKQTNSNNKNSKKYALYKNDKSFAFNNNNNNYTADP